VDVEDPQPILHGLNHPPRTCSYPSLGDEMMVELGLRCSPPGTRLRRRVDGSDPGSRTAVRTLTSTDLSGKLLLSRASLEGMLALSGSSQRGESVQGFRCKPVRLDPPLRDSTGLQGVRRLHFDTMCFQDPVSS